MPVRIFPDGRENQGILNIDGIDSFKGFNFVGADEIVANLMRSGQLYTQKDRGFMGNPLSLPEQGDQILSVAADSRSLFRMPGKANEILMRAARIEDPTKNLPGTVDCISCHIANATKLIANVTQLPLPLPKMIGDHNLTNNSVFYGDTHQLRMLGYVTNKVQVADRSIFEAASVANYLNTH